MVKEKWAPQGEDVKRTGEDNIDTERVTFYEYGEYHNKFVRALRLAKLLFRYLHLVLCDLYFCEMYASVKLYFHKEPFSV